MTTEISSTRLITRKSKKLRSRAPQIDTSQARSNMEVLQACLKELGWKECISGSSTHSDIYWNSGSFQDGGRDYSTTTTQINKFPGMQELMCKSNLTRALNIMKRLFPDEYNFYPKTWFLPEQKDQFEEDARSIHKKEKNQRRRLTTFIVKPSDGSEGAGIYLIQDPSRCNIANRPYIVQEYIDRPLLMNGLKFDMRIYVVILQLDPLQILLYDEGLARFATVDYQAPSTKNLHETFMHLTNYSLNKRSATYKHATDEKETEASKRKLSVVWSQLSYLFSQDEIEHTKERIEEMINKTVLAILPQLRVEYASELSTTTRQNRCFQIIGFDIILTDKLKPILLEVNANPSLRIDFDHLNEAGKLVHEPSPIDIEIKKPLVSETLKFVMKYKRCRNPQKIERQINVNDSLNSDPDDDSNEESNEATLAMNIIQNITDRKSLRFIFPSTFSAKYEPMFLLEKTAFIYIELVTKRGYKGMTSRPFRNLATCCGIIDESIPMSSIDILYGQVFYKCKEYDSQSPAIGLQFPAFIDALFLLAQKKHPDCTTLLDSVTNLIEHCVSNLGLSFNESS